MRVFQQVVCLVVEKVENWVVQLAIFVVATKVEKMVCPQVASSDEQLVAMMEKRLASHSVAPTAVWMAWLWVAGTVA